MNFDQWTGILRAVVPAAVALLVSHVPILGGASDTIIAGVIAFGSAVWSVFNNKTGKTIT